MPGKLSAVHAFLETDCASCHMPAIERKRADGSGATLDCVAEVEGLAGIMIPGGESTTMLKLIDIVDATFTRGLHTRSFRFV